jgi:dipeptidyl-peptidase-4
MNKRYLILLLSAFSWKLQAQQKQFTMQDAVLGLRTHLAPANLQQFSWIPGLNSYSHLVGEKEHEALLRTSVPQMKQDTVIRLRQINEQLFAKAPLKTMPLVKWLDQNQFYFQIKNDFYICHKQNGYWQSRKWTSLPSEAENINVDTKHKQIAYTINNNLFLKDVYGSEHKISNDENEQVIYGQSVHRNEFGIKGGTFFSPKGNYLAFYRMDESMVNDYPVINWKDIPAANENIKYPMAGGTSHEVSLGIYNPLSRRTVYLQIDGPRDQYLTCVSWSPDEKFMYVAILNRDQNHMRLNQYNADNGAFIKTLFEEKDAKYVEPQHELTFLPENNNEFIWWSQRDGFMHLYRFNTQGKLLNQITKGSWIVNELAGIRKEKQELIITATKESPLEKHIYKVNWINGKMEKLDEAAGMHSAELSADGAYIVDRYQNKDVPRNIVVRAVDKKWSRNILTAPNTLTDYQRPTIETVTLKADDGTPLYGKLIYPVNFDATKKYPVIVYLYNGPHVQLVNNSFPESGNLWYEYLAQRGYIVFTMDGRGSSNRGLKFEQATFRNLGKVEMDDQLQGVQYLKNLPFVDAARMGVHGWSYGGFMTTSLMTRHPGVFKVAVAGGPVIDWSMYEIMYTERYMDGPKENPQGYEENNLISKAANLKGKLLMIHGAQDDVVVWQHSMKFVKACVDAGVQLDYFVYPGHAHNVQGKDRVHLMQKITDYFDDFLK